MTDHQTPDAAHEHARQSAPARGRLARRAGSMSLGIVVSRITGLVREQTLAYLFPTALLDAFYAAYTFPNTLRELLGEGALSKAFVATFAAVDEGEGPEAAHRLFTRVFRTMLPLGLLVTVLGVVFAPQLVDVVFSRGAFEKPLGEEVRFGFLSVRELTIWLMRLMFPFICFVSLAALFMGALQARKSFFLPGVASAFFNVTTIVFAVLGFAAAPSLGLHPMAGLAIGVPLGGIAQMLPQALWFRRSGYRRTSTQGVRATLRDSAFRRVCRLFLPAAASAGNLQLNVLISRHFASGGTSWLSWLNFAYRLVQLPSGLIVAALSGATLPSLTRRAGRDDRGGFDAMLAQSGRLMTTLTMAAAAGLIGIAEPVVALIYERGEFTNSDSVQVAAMLSLFALGLPAFGATKLLTDAFFAQGSTRAPLLVTSIGVVLTWVATHSFVVTAELGPLGLPLATVAVAWVSSGLLAMFLARRLGVDERGRGRARAVYLAVSGSAARGLVAAVACGASAWYASRLVVGALGGGGLEDAVACLLGVGAGGGVWLLAIRLVAPRDFAPVRDALVDLKRRFRRKHD